MRKLTSCLIILLIAAGCSSQLKTTGIDLPEKTSLNFIVISDYGRKGFHNQKKVAVSMGKVAEEINARFIVTGGDNFQVDGVESVSDPLWMSCFENIYTNPSLYVEWYPALGNHDHEGNIQAQIDYSRISPRWRMPAPYYSVVKKSDSVSIRLVIVDTYSFVQGLSKPGRKFSDACAMKQIHWTDSVLAAEKEDWLIVNGHHPVFSAHPTRGNTDELVEYLYPLLKKHNVDFYIGSHDHIFQHLKDSASNTDYLVNTAGSSVRNAANNNMTVFTASSPGFSIISATKKKLSVFFINKDGVPIYEYSRTKN